MNKTKSSCLVKQLAGIFFLFAVWLVFGNTVLYSQQTKPAFIATAAKKTKQQKPLVYFPVSQEGKWGYIDSSGKIAVAMQFDQAGRFKDGLAAVSSGTQWGYIDIKGNFMINPQFDYADEFSEELAPVGVDKKRGFIGKTGHFIVEPKFTNARRFSEGLAFVGYNFYKPGQEKIKHSVPYWALGYIDKTRRLVFTNEDNMHLFYNGDFSEGLIMVTDTSQQPTKWGFADKTGKIVIGFEFEDCDLFKEGLAIAKIRGKYGFIDKTGRYIIDPQFDDAYSFAEGLAVVRLGALWGYIDKTGKQAINYQFTDAQPFSEGLASVALDEKWGYIDNTGKMVIQPQFKYVERFGDGLALVALEKEGEVLGKAGYIDKTGKYVWNPSARQGTTGNSNTSQETINRTGQSITAEVRNGMVETYQRATAVIETQNARAAAHQKELEAYYEKYGGANK